MNFKKKGIRILLMSPMKRKIKKTKEKKSILTMKKSKIDGVGTLEQWELMQ